MRELTMRRMPTFILKRTTSRCGFRTSNIPAIKPKQWNAMVRAMIGRNTTHDEDARIEEMAEHNWTARVVAEEILGRDVAEEEMAKICPG